MEPVEIAAGRLQLRPYGRADVPRLVEACQDPETIRYTNLPSPYTTLDAEDMLVGLRRVWAEETGAHFGVFDATDGDLLGDVALVRLDLPRGNAEIGFWTAPWARGLGVATRATQAVARWTFAELAVGRLEWLADVDNVASRRVAERAGFTLEGVLRDRIRRRDGSRANARIASLLPRDLE